MTQFNKQGVKFIVLQSILYLLWLFLNQTFSLPLFGKLLFAALPFLSQFIFLYILDSKLTFIYLAASSVVISVLLFNIILDYSFFTITLHDLSHWLQAPVFLGVVVLRRK